MPGNDAHFGTMLQNLFDKSPSALIGVDTERRITRVNPAFVAAFGYTPEEVVGKTPRDLYFNVEDYDEACCQGDIRTGAFSNKPFIETYRRKDGSKLIGDTLGIPIEDENGIRVGFCSVIRDVTEHLERTDSLTATERVFQDAMSSVSETAWRLNFATGKIDIAGPAAMSVFGRSEPRIEIDLESWKERLTDEGKQACDIVVRSLLDQGRASGELAFHDQEGGNRIFADKGRVVEYDRDGKPLVAAGTIADITEQKNIEAERQALDRWLKAGMEAAELAAWRYEARSRDSFVFGPLARRLGIEAVETPISGEAWSAKVHPDDLRGIIKGVAEINSRQSDTFDILYRLKDQAGEWRWVRSKGAVTERHETGEVYVSGILKDETTSIDLQNRLAEERSRFEAIFQSTPAMVHQIDEKGRIVDVSDFWLSEMGYDRHEVIGQSAVKFLTEESRRYAVEHAMPAFFEKGTCRNMAFQFEKKDGSIIDTLLNGYLEKKSGAHPARGYIVVMDVSPLRKAYRDLERSNRELDRFATIASHDLLEPVRKISAFAQVVSRKYSERLDAEGRQSLEFMLDAARRMQALIQNLLEYSQLESRPMKVEMVNLPKLVNELKGELSDRISGSGAEIELTGDINLKADRFLLSQILRNLISNSIKYRSEAAPHIQINLDCSQNECRLTFADNGIGFDPKFADQIFEPFRRLHAKGSYEGSGIGLAIVQQAVERQQGRISVESQPGHGTVFKISIPKA